MTEVKAQLVEANTSIEELMTQIEELDGVETQLENAKAHVAELTAMADQARVEAKLELQSARREAGVAEARVEELNEQIQTMGMAAMEDAELLSELEEKVTQLQAENARLAASAPLADEYKARYAEVAAKLDVATAALDDLTAAADELDAADALCASLAQVLTDKLAAVDAERSELAARTAEINLKLAVNNEALDEMRAEVRAAKATAADGEAALRKVAGLSARLKEATAKAESASAAAAKHSAKARELAAKVAELEATLKTETAHASAAVTEAQTEAKAARAAAGKAQTVVAELETQLAEAQAVAAQLPVKDAQLAASRRGLAGQDGGHGATPGNVQRGHSLARARG